jgi:flagellar hook-basal body complex protein FliE
MTVNLAAGAAAYAKAAKQLAMPGGNAAVKGTGSGFGDMLKSALTDAIDTQKTGETASLQAATGKADINSVVAAVNNAELTLQTVLAVRDKVVAAYTEIMHMTV